MQDKFTPTNDTHAQVQALWEAICEEAKNHMSFFSWMLFQNTPFVELGDRSLVQLADAGDVEGLQKVLDLIHEAEAGEPVEEPVAV